MVEKEKVQPVKGKAIIEVLGAPEEHVKSTMSALMDKLKQEKNMEILDIDVSNTEKQDTLFSVFAEVEIEFLNPMALTGFCFDYMPSSIDVFEPKKIEFLPKEMSDMFNDLQAKLHNVDMVAKQANAQIQISHSNLAKLIRNFIVFLRKAGIKDPELMAKHIGVQRDLIDKAIESMLKEKEKDKKAEENTKEEGKQKTSENDSQKQD